MDIVDKVTYDFEWGKEENISEETRRAFVELFDVSNDNACLVMRHLVGLCAWNDFSDCSDPIINAKAESLRGVIRNIKKQLNMKPIQLEEADYE